MKNCGANRPQAAMVARPRLARTGIWASFTPMPSSSPQAIHVKSFSIRAFAGAPLGWRRNFDASQMNNSQPPPPRAFRRGLSSRSMVHFPGAFSDNDHDT
jgi:hypothetical protein